MCCQGALLISVSLVSSSYWKCRLLQVDMYNGCTTVVGCSVLFFSRPRFEGWPHHGRSFSIHPCPLSFWLTLPRGVLSTCWCWLAGVAESVRHMLVDTYTDLGSSVFMPSGPSRTLRAVSSAVHMREGSQISGAWQPTPELFSFPLFSCWFRVVD